MKIEVLKPIISLGVLHRSGVIEAPEAAAKHWIASGAAKAVAAAVVPAAPESRVEAKVEARELPKKGKGF